MTVKYIDKFPRTCRKYICSSANYKYKIKLTHKHKSMTVYAFSGFPHAFESLKDILFSLYIDFTYLDDDEEIWNSCGLDCRPYCEKQKQKFINFLGMNEYNRFINLHLV